MAETGLEEETRAELSARASTVPVLPPRDLVWWKRYQEKAVATRFGTWFAVVIATRVDRRLLRWSRGRVALFAPWPVGLLQMTGARSGEPRTAPLLYLADGERVVLVASNGGDPRHPAWYHNVRANPRVTFTKRGRRQAFRAREAVGQERAELWLRVTHLYAGYEKYQRNAGDRLIPLVVLDPEAGQSGAGH